ncbi:probable inactive poly [ADP-ribose] polymerase SRO5 [Rhodamnia argentea]|uniref:Probable inactive poly [ADP-ribose] polymerase SRO5 n=1 Tax=Rhodamnia argentea TaxID=178133 RepID=A0A8B8QXC9_9MYRT|nr:probable inactive poly [ADP-ribose] polymerase SRO5 [Rhodamnia argentea]
MAHHTHQCRSPAVHTATPDAVTREFNCPAIDLNCPPPDDLMVDQDLNPSVSDCNSAVSADQCGSPPSLFIGGELMELSEEDNIHHLMGEHLVSRLAMLGARVTLVAILRICYSDFSAKERAKAFQVHSEAAQKKVGDNTINVVKFAWYAASKPEVLKILSCGFGYIGKPGNNGSYGCGVYFSPFDHPLESAVSAPFDEDGLRHLLLCRVILGKSEIVSLGSGRSHLISEEYDSGVDDLSFPRRYIIRSAHLNIRVLPAYIVSFRVSCCSRGFWKTPEKLENLTTPWTPFPIFFWELSKILPPSHVSLISKYHKDHKERKIARHELVQKIRRIAGDKLLTRFIKDMTSKAKKIPRHELIPKYRQITGDGLLIEIIESLKTKQSGG